MLIVKALKTISSLLLLMVGLLFTYFTGLVFFEEILPAMRNGTLMVETNSMILNRVWEGNEIYDLLIIYAGIAASLFVAGTILARNALRDGSHT